VLSIAFITSIMLLPLIHLSVQGIHWGHETTSAGSIKLVAKSLQQRNSIQRWIVRVARRKEAPDDDADSPSLD